MKNRILLLTILLVFACTSFAQMPVETYNIKVSEKLELRGLTHVRYQLFDDTSKIDGFDIRRARLDFRGDVAPKMGYRLHLEFANSPKILDATIAYKPFDWLNVNVGQSKTPYCYDNLYGPWTLLTISRTQIDNALSNREADLYGNNNGRDIGFWLSGKYSIGEEGNKRPLLDYTVGVYNGSGINVADVNQAKDFGGALGVSPIKNLWIFGRYYTGTGRTTVDPETDATRKRYGGNITYNYKNFLIEAEYLQGFDEIDTVLQYNRNGYYVTLGYTPIKDKLQVVARLDNYDSNTHVPLKTVNKYVVGASWFFTKNTRIQVEYDIVAEEDSNNQLKNNVFAVQFQAGF